MNAKEFSDLLTLLDACPRAREWAKGKSLQSAWKTCKRGDWLLWLSGYMADKPGWPTRKEVVLAACDCAETALQYVKAGDDHPRKCIETVRAWADGKATLYDVGTARRAAYGYTTADSAAYATADYAAYAARAAADAAAYAADRTKTLAKCAVIVRKRLYIPKAGANT